MRIKGPPSRAKLQPLRVVIVTENGKDITHIYRSRESFRKDELARYSKKLERIIKGKSKRPSSP